MKMILLSRWFIATLVLIVSFEMIEQSEDHEHTKALKDFVENHPHLHELVDKIHLGDEDAKHEFERRSLSARFNDIKKRLPVGTDEVHIVIHFLDDYTRHMKDDIATPDHTFMTLEPFVNMMEKEEDLREQLLDLGKKLEEQKCDFSCLGDNLAVFMNEAMTRITSHVEL